MVSEVALHGGMLRVAKFDMFMKITYLKEEEGELEGRK